MHNNAASFLVIVMMALGFISCSGLTNNRAETNPDHPDASLRPRTYTVAYDSFFETVLHVIGWLPRWKVVEQDIENGKIGATRQTKFFRFVDDVEIHVTKKGEGEVTVNLRSASRVGKGDFGQNARNIREFLKALDREIAADTRP
ncbi:DUF1499 domain-containing protein [bacterium AH-315-L15]|nr:DUF1499 domain-containing protein [bacterium AH-315-L15]